VVVRKNSRRARTCGWNCDLAMTVNASSIFFRISLSETPGWATTGLLGPLQDANGNSALVCVEVELCECASGFE
jgi:hypothetical protein